MINQNTIHKKPIFILIGPSASGKTTLIKKSKNELNFGVIISTTTRNPRIGEKNGVDYYFVTRNEFQKLNMIESDEYSGNLYGISLESIMSITNNKDGAMTAMTLEGAEIIRNYIENSELPFVVKTIFVNTPIAVLKQRMTDRGDSSEEIARRMKNIEDRREYDNRYKTDFVYEPIITNSEDDVINFIKFVKNISEKIM